MERVLNYNMRGKVTIYTQTYNAISFLRRCVESVLRQTYTNFEYILVDNGCTDGSSELLECYAAQDERIKLIQFPENRKEIITSIVKHYGTGEYYTVLDSDDWWELDYLEKLVHLAKQTHSDIVCTGTLMHVEGTSQLSARKLEQRIIIGCEEYANMLPLYHAFFRANWAKLVDMNVFSTCDFAVIDQLEFPYGKDTLRCFAMLRRSAKLCVDNSVLHHYRIHRKSSSYYYDPNRFKSDVYLYDDAIDFLTTFGPVSAQNRNFLQSVYSNALIDTLGVIRNASLPPADKLQEYRTIATHPLTQAAYRECTDESAARSRVALLNLILQTGAALKTEEDANLRAALQALLPHCGQAVIGRNLSLFLQDQTLLQCLLKDDADLLVRQLLMYISENRYAKKYDLANVVQTLAVDKPLLCQIGNTVFLRNYSGLYLSAWQGETLPALEEMTGLLLENQVTRGKETFLQLYISLAALEDQAPAFVFGKLQMAKLYLRQNKREECRGIVKELIEMGLDNEELFQLRQELEERS